MKPDSITETIEIPDGCSVEFQNFELKVKGSKGESLRKITTPKISVSVNKKQVVFTAKKPSKREKRLIKTYKAHILNMFKGVTKGHIYKLKICSGHFPMSVNIKNNFLEIKNFLGEKIPRTLKLKQGAEVKVQGDMITIESSEKELAGSIAGQIEKLTKRPKFDKRIFQDGIYIVEKDSKKM